MYINTSFIYHRVTCTCTQYCVITKVYDLLGQPSYIFSTKIRKDHSDVHQYVISRTLKMTFALKLMTSKSNKIIPILSCKLLRECCILNLMTIHRMYTCKGMTLYHHMLLYKTCVEFV